MTSPAKGGSSGGCGGVRRKGGVQGPLQHAECGGESRVPWRHEILHIEMNISIHLYDFL